MGEIAGTGGGTGAPTVSRLAGDRRLPPPPAGEARALCGDGATTPPPQCDADP